MTTTTTDYMRWTIDEARVEFEIAMLGYRALVEHVDNVPPWAWDEDSARAYALGLHYGYPPCCIEQFCAIENSSARPSPHRAAVMHAADLKHVPCDECVARLEPHLDPEVVAALAAEHQHRRQDDEIPCDDCVAAERSEDSTPAALEPPDAVLYATPADYRLACDVLRVIDLDDMPCGDVLAVIDAVRYLERMTEENR